jgi:restriction system protein
MAIPKYDELFNPLIEAFHTLGGSGSVTELEDKVAEILNLTEKEINEIHRGNRTKLSYRLAWSRNYLKRFGLLENSSRGIWSLTAKRKEVESVDKDIVNKAVKSLDKELNNQESVSETIEETELWEEEMLKILKEMPPDEFERLCQRLLRESGFIEVKVTGKSGDSGIDGRGIVRIGGFLSFRVIFQCKRYQGSVSSQLIREFKGTMMGRADKGLFITTGKFTRDAKDEANRDSSTPIDIIDGQELALKMKELGLGVKIKNQEVVEIDNEWFKNF